MVLASCLGRCSHNTRTGAGSRTVSIQAPSWQSFHLPRKNQGKKHNPQTHLRGGKRNDEAQAGNTPAFYPCTSFPITASTSARQPNDFKCSTMGSVLMQTLKTLCPIEDKLLKAVIVCGQVLSAWFLQSNTG